MTDPIPTIDAWAPRNARALDALVCLEWLLGLGPRPGSPPRAKRKLTPRAAPIPVRPPRPSESMTIEERRRRWCEYARARRADPAVRAREAELALARRGGPKPRPAPLTPEERKQRRREHEAHRRALMSPEQLDAKRARDRARAAAHRATMSREALRAEWLRHQHAHRARQRAA